MQLPAAGCRASSWRRWRWAGYCGFERGPRQGAPAMGWLLWLAMRLAPALTSGPNGLAQAILLVILMVAGIAIYGLFLRLFGVADWREAVSAFRQNAPGDLHV